VSAELTQSVVMMEQKWPSRCTRWPSVGCAGQEKMSPNLSPNMKRPLLLVKHAADTYTPSVLCYTKHFSAFRCQDVMEDASEWHKLFQNSRPEIIFTFKCSKV
jgi:hypothetical protein